MCRKLPVYPSHMPRYSGNNTVNFKDFERQRFKHDTNKYRIT